MPVNDRQTLHALFFSNHRLIYDELIGNPSYLDKVLQQGAERAREVAKSNLHEIKSAIGLGSLS